MLELEQCKQIALRWRERFRFWRRYKAPFIRLSRIGEFRGDSFPSAGPDCWLDRPDAEQAIERRLRAGEIDAEEARVCRAWVEDGYCILPAFFSAAVLDETWAAYESALAEGRFGQTRYVNPRQTMHDRSLDAHMQVPEIRSLQHDPRLRKWTDLLFGRKTVPFQTIMGHAGSQQKAHSDSIHMTTYPLGYLIGAWIAFEDISAESGPLNYYPRSHRLPYILSKEAGILPNEFREKGYAIYSERYEPLIESACTSAGLEERLFLAKKGDVLLWHANLVHGGTRRKDPELTRKALVCHYFAEGAVTYHDLSGNPSRLHRGGIYAPLESA